MADHFSSDDSSRFPRRIAKVGPPIKINFFEPYGSSANAGLVTKAGGEVPLPPPKAPTGKASKVRRLNARNG